MTAQSMLDGREKTEPKETEPLPVSFPDACSALRKTAGQPLTPSADGILAHLVHLSRMGEQLQQFEFVQPSDKDGQIQEAASQARAILGSLSLSLNRLGTLSGIKKFGGNLDSLYKLIDDAQNLTPDEQSLFLASHATPGAIMLKVGEAVTALKELHKLVSDPQKNQLSLQQYLRSEGTIDQRRQYNRYIQAVTNRLREVLEITRPST